MVYAQEMKEDKEEKINKKESYDSQVIPCLHIFLIVFWGTWHLF